MIERRVKFVDEEGREREALQSDYIVYLLERLIKLLERALEKLEKLEKLAQKL